jgi:aminopeptidase
MESRYRKLAETLIGYSLEIQPGDKILIEATEIPHAFTNTLVETAADFGAHPLVLLKDLSILRRLLHSATREQMELWSASEKTLMEGVDAYVGLRGAANVSELSDVPPDRMKLYETLIWRAIHIDLRVKEKRWVVLRWPSGSMAQLSEVSTEAFEDYYFKVCTLDYGRMSEAMQPLKQLMEQTNEVGLVAPGTDLRFSIEGIPAVCCDGKRNLPDGEVYTAPVRDSINGVIQYNCPTVYQGVTHEQIRLEFRDGQIVDSASSNSQHLKSVLDTDEGSRYVGEFAIGFNPYITKPMKDILFDEKIAGSIHLTPGNAYDLAFNGNRSQIHWDMILMMAPENGGGEIHFDGRLVRKDGRFVLPELEGLNPEQLIQEG